MKHITASPATLQSIVATVTPGTIISLQGGIYREPVEMKNLRGSEEEPIILSGQADVVFDGGVTFEEFQPTAIEWCWRNTENGRYPGLYDDAKVACIRMEECSHIIIENINFRKFWPTILYFNNSTSLQFRHLKMIDGTFAIYGEGDESREILVENCEWIQDETREKLWFKLGWEALHGRVRGIDGARAFDGAFFRTRNIAGEVIIRENVVSHAANGVHMFNRKPNKNRVGLNNNIQIYNNYFSYIRDNTFEPEERAINWWIFNNEIENCHKTFSLELDTCGFFYIYGNRIWSNSKPGIGEEHTGGGLFKMTSKYTHSVGPFYVFNNSYFLRTNYIKKGQIVDFSHWNNAIAFCDEKDSQNNNFCENKCFFGTKENASFTDDWEILNIEFSNDLYHHHGFPHEAKYKTYKVKDHISGDPLYTNPQEGMFLLGLDSPALNNGKQIELKLADGSIWISASSPDIGAYQGEEIIQGPEYVKYEE